MTGADTPLSTPAIPSHSTGTLMIQHSQRIVGIAMLVLVCGPLVHAADAAAPASAAAAAVEANPARPAAAPVSAGEAEAGLAAVYSDRLHGRPTASGERYDRNRLTAAHKTLPFGTRVKVTNTKKQKSVTVRINDRGPMQAGRILDLSPTAAKAIGIGPKGMAEVSAEVVGEAPKQGKQ
jgi:rare lipoprotein A